MSGEVAVINTNIMVNPEALIAKGIENNLSVEGMQKLLDMRAQLKAEYAKEEYYKALAKFQKECPAIEKKKIVKDKFGKEVYKYAPLEDIIAQVKDPLEANGFSYTHKMHQTKDEVTVICETHHVAGHTESTEITVPAVTSGYMSAVQNIGSATTYGKRYTFCNAWGIMTGDEDTDGADSPGDDKKASPVPADKPAAPAQNQKPAQSAPAQKQPESGAKDLPYMLKDGEEVPAWFMALAGAEKIKWAPKGFSIRGGKICVHKAS